MYDFLIVGSGLYGAVFAHEAKAHGKSVLVVDKRPNIAGNIYTENIEGINVHKYGAHIFHTNNKDGSTSNADWWIRDFYDTAGGRQRDRASGTGGSNASAGMVHIK